MPHVLINPAFAHLFSNQPLSFHAMMQSGGKVYRKIGHRETIRLELSQQPCFIKKHFGVGWKEIFKNFFQGKWPILSAKNEFLALQFLEKRGIPAPLWIAYGRTTGFNPARIRSFVIMTALTRMKNLEDLAQEWRTHSPSFQLKQYLIFSVAKLIAQLHKNGINHRDCYLCHIYLPENIQTTMPSKPFPLYILDLHRAQIHVEVPERWRIKDLSGLYSSSFSTPTLTQKDRLHFLKNYVKIYSNQSLKETLSTNRVFWRRIQNKGDCTLKRWIEKNDGKKR